VVRLPWWLSVLTKFFPWSEIFFIGGGGLFFFLGLKVSPTWWLSVLTNNKIQ
jgi:hypothetical protein